jgi:DNA modification methylase
MKKATGKREAAAQWVSVELLKPWAKNPRKNDRTVDHVVKSMERFGFGAPIIARQANGEVIAGHTRLLAAMKMGMKKVPVRYLDLSEKEAHALALADNKIAEFSDWEDELLDTALGDLKDDPELFNATGFDYSDFYGTRALPGEDVVSDPPKVPTTRLGDVWMLGDHRLLCGDSTEPDSVLLAKGPLPFAECMWTDPPYGVSYTGKTKSAMTIENDELPMDDLEEFISKAFGAADSGLAMGAAIYVASPSGPQLCAFMKAFLAQEPWAMRQGLVWVKDTLVLGRNDYHYRHETILTGYKRLAKGKGRSGRGGTGWYGDNAQTSVFEVNRPKANKEHPTMKPPELVQRMLENSTGKGGVVFDPFGGSGSTLIACEQMNRRCFTIELSPGYCDVIVKRWEGLTGRKASLARGDAVSSTG